MAFTIKRNDLLPVYRAQLLQTDPETNTTVPVDLSEATSVKFIMGGTTGSAIVSRPAVVDDPVDGIVSYSWTNGDTSTAGDFSVEIEVMWGVKPQTFPSNGYLTCKIVADLG